MSTRRVFITGIGLVTPLGRDRETSWSRYCSGASGLRWLPETDGTAESSLWPAHTAGGPVPSDLAEWIPSPAAGTAAMSLVNQEPAVTLALAAAHEAAADAALDAAPLGDRAATVIGTSKGGVHSALALARRRRAPGAEAESADPGCFWSQIHPGCAATAVARQFGTRAAALAPVAACATGLVCLIRAAELIQHGLCDVVLAGSADASLTPAVVASFRRLGVLARNFDDPATAVRPFDQSRNGFLIGEGAAVFVLESAEHAARRQVRACAEWITGGLASDAAGLTQLADDPASLRWLIRDVLRRGNIRSHELDLVSLHGTATSSNDACEAAALDAILRDSPASNSRSGESSRRSTGAVARRTPAFSAKGSLGHLLGAAGSVEFALMLLALRDQTLPPTANLHCPMPTDSLELTPLADRRPKLQHALKLSLGFGGHLAAAMVRKL